MNLSELKNVENGDEVVFVVPFYPFTVGKRYRVTKTGVGNLIYDDNGFGRFLCGIEDHFEREVETCTKGT